MSQPSQFMRRTWIDHSCEVAASASTLHALLSDAENWPRWTPGLLAFKRRGRGPMRAGERFLMVLAAPYIRWLLLPCQWFANEPLRLEWGGGAFGAAIRHSFELEPLGPERTRLRHVEYATSWLALVTRPAEAFAYNYDKCWSDTIAARFAGTDASRLGNARDVAHVA